MKQVIAIIAMAATLASAVPADAAGCIKGAIVGGVAGHLAHHTLLGALGGCIVGHEMAKSGTSTVYADIGTMLGDGSADADWAKIAAASKVSVIKISSLKGYVSNDTRMQSAIRANAGVKTLDTRIGANANLTDKVKHAGFTPDEVIAAGLESSGAASLFVDK
jgi:methylmalonyl-CoA mutase cobalamin-binding subunit